MSPLTDRHRRRSHSASSPIPRHQPDDVKWRISAKRSRPSSIRSPSYKDLARDQPAEKWDVDLWRKGKKARRDFNTEGSSDKGSCSNSLATIDAAFPTPDAPTSCSSAPGLPCTSAAFRFFPQKPKSRRYASGPSRARLSREASPREGDRVSSDEARRMRASALGELHRTVTENGEGLVSRMRDWERSRLRAPRSVISPSVLDAPRRMWRPRPTSYYGIPQAETAVAEQSEDEEDDIFIVGETSSFGIARSPAHKKRALSLSVMDVDTPDALSSPFGLGDGDRSSSPIDRSSCLSAYSSDDEGHADMDTDLSSSGIFSTPALSHVYSTSANSSLVSLPLPAQANESGMITASPSSATIVPRNTPPPTASRSEKAIAALALAMANGAAGISDYEALRVTEGLSTLEESHAGELWN